MSALIQKLFWLALAGGLGTLSRYGLSSLAQTWAQSTLKPGWGLFPWGTLTVNILGCFLFGLIWSFSVEREWVTPEMRMVLLTGFLGGFTTFSSFGFETQQLLEKSQWLFAGLNIALQNVIGLAAVFLALTLARKV